MYSIHILLLQVNPTNFGIFERLSQYGILGLVCLALGAVSWLLFKRQLKSEEILKKELELTRNEFKSYILNDQRELREVVRANTNVMEEFRTMVHSALTNNSKKN